MTTNTKPRSFNPIDLVMLPVLDASSAVAIGEEILTRTKDEELSEPVADAVQMLERALSELREARRGRFDVASATEEERKESARTWRAAWGRFHGWLEAWARLPDGADRHGPEAKRIFAAVFEGGLKFLRVPYKAGWADGDERLVWLEGEKVDGMFRALGGLVFLEEVRSAHRTYGEVLGIKKNLDPVPEAPSVREPLDLFRAQLREYVVQVSAEGAQHGKGAKERAARLLTPIAAFQSRTRVTKEVDVEAGTEPEVAPPVE